MAGLFEQAAILNLYDPDRSRMVRRGADLASWSDFVAFAETLAGPMWVLAGPSSSPTEARLRDRLRELINNLVDNAIEATIEVRAQGGTATADIATGADDPTCLTTLRLT